MLKNIKPRIYQETIFHTCTQNNCLVVLPTGLGKTLIAAMLAIQRLSKYPDSKIILLSPTKPLVEQHMNTFLNHIEKDNMVVFTGLIPPEKRQELWNKNQFFFSTPQGLENDILSKKISLDQVSLIIFDEAHRATGDYSYNYIAKNYMQFSKYPKILALTASPGNDLEKINEVCNNLHIEEVEIRSEEDPDVKPYVQETNVNWIKVKLTPQLIEIKNLLNTCYLSKLREVKSLGYLNTLQLNKKDILKLQKQIHAQIHQGNKDPSIWKSISLLAEAMKVQHAQELLETQGSKSLLSYMNKLIEESKTTKTKATQNLVRDINFRSALIKTKININNEFPKITKLKEILNNIKDKKAIIFTQFRDTASIIQSSLNYNSKVFVGQRGETGLSQKKQIEILNQFKNNEFQILIATSVAEEGLDIPKVDYVIFYEPIPSAIRHIQRRGRTGRNEKGDVIVLLCENTRDEAYRWSAFHKEKKMKSLLSKIKITKPQKKLEDYQKSNEKIYVDVREKGSSTMKRLLDLGVDVEIKKLDSADYILSSRIGIEFKTVEDFVNSIIDGRLLTQVKNLKENFPKPLLIIEGSEDLYSIRKINPASIQGMLSTITIDFNIPILQTKNPRETAELLKTIAKREQESNKDFTFHSKKPLTMQEQQEYIVSAFPGIGVTLSKPLLSHFSSIKNIVNASEEELKKVDLIGPTKAKNIRKILDTNYFHSHHSQWE